MHTARGHVEAHLAHGDAHAIRAQVAQAQDALAVRHHDEVHLGLGQALEDLVDVGDVLGRDVDAAEAALDVAQLHAGLAHGGRVDDGHHLIQVVDQEPVEQHLVPVQESRQVDVLLHVVWLAEEGLVGAVQLGFQGRDARPQHAVQPQTQPLLLGKGRGLVQVGIVQELPPSNVDLVVFLARQRIDLEHEGLHGCPFTWGPARIPRHSQI